MPDYRALALQWEKFSAPQSIPNDESFPYETVTGWESQPDYAPPMLGRAFNPSTGIFTIPASGLYLIDAQVQFAANATGRRGLGIGGGLDMEIASPGAFVARLAIHETISTDNPGVAPGLAVPMVIAYQNSGAPLNLTFALLSIVFLPETIHEVPSF